MATDLKNDPQYWIQALNLGTIQGFPKKRHSMILRKDWMIFSRIVFEFKQ